MTGPLDPQPVARRGLAALLPRRVAGAWSGSPHGPLLGLPILAGAWLIPLGFLPIWQDTFIRPKVMLATLLMAAILLARAVPGSRSYPPIGEQWSGLAWAVGALASLNLAAFALSVDRSQSLIGEPLQYQGLLSVLLYLGFFWTARSVFATEQQADLLLKAIATAGAVVVGYALVQRAGLDPIWDRPRGTRVFSTIGQPNALAAYLVMIVPITIALGHRATRTVWRFTAIAAAVAGTVALAFTKSRGGYLGIVVAIVALMIGLRRIPAERRRRWGAVAAGTAVLALALGPVVVTAAGDVWSRAVGGLEGDSITQHLALWEVGIAIAADNPWFGTGQETFPLLYPDYEHVLDAEAAGSLNAYRPESPHNAYVAIAAGAGFPALVAYAAVLFLALTSVWKGIGLPGAGRTAILRVGIGAALLGHLVTDAFITQDISGSWVAWVLLGAGVGLGRGAAAPAGSEDSLRFDPLD